MARRQDQLDTAAQPRRPFLGRRVPLENAYSGPHARESIPLGTRLGRSGSRTGAARLAHRYPVSTYNVFGRQHAPQRAQAQRSRHPPPRARIARLLPRRLQRSDYVGAWLPGRADVDLVRAGLATAKSERVAADGKAIEVARVRITEAGRRALANIQRCFIAGE
jgi:hypothetical protein